MDMRHPLRTCALLLSLVGLVAAQNQALAQVPPDADALFKRGVEQMQAGNYDPGCKDIAESLRLKWLPGTLFTLATCMDRWGHVATAVALYREYLAVYEKLPNDRKAVQDQTTRPKVAREQRDKLEQDVPELTLTLPPDAPARTLVKRDGQEVAASALGVAFSLDPGQVVVTTQAPGGPVSEQRITIGKGEKKKVILEVKVAPAAVAPPPKVEVQPLPQPFAPDGTSVRRKAAFAIGGVGIAGVTLGAVMGILTLGEKGTIDQHCGEAINAPKTRCDPTGLDAAHRSKPFGLASTIGFAVGGAGLGVGLVLFLSEKQPTSTPAFPELKKGGSLIIKETPF